MPGGRRMWAADGKLKGVQLSPIATELTMSATHICDSTPKAGAKLYLAFERGWTSWNLAFTTAMAQKPRLRTIAARDVDGLQREIQRAKQRFALPDTITVHSCYEAGRDGFWLHRYLDQ